MKHDESSLSLSFSLPSVLCVYDKASSRVSRTRARARECETNEKITRIYRFAITLRTMIAPKQRSRDRAFENKADPFRLAAGARGFKRRFLSAYSCETDDPRRKALSVILRNESSSFAVTRALRETILPHDKRIVASGRRRRGTRKASGECRAVASSISSPVDGASFYPVIDYFRCRNSALVSYREKRA